MDRNALHQRWLAVRRATERLCEPLETEDFVVQTMPLASPVKWHLAHTTWFFEELVLKPAVPGYRPFDERFSFLFNSYYESLGDRTAQPERGLLSRPTVRAVFDYRRHVDAWLERAFDAISLGLAELGVNHEEQHQELIVTDLKHAFATQPLRPIYRAAPVRAPAAATPSRWVPCPDGLVDVGDPGDGFAFDNERARHRVYLAPFELQSRLVTCGEYLEFMRAGGYDQPGLWLSDGWEARRRLGWCAPLYWQRQGDDWIVLTLAGPRPIDPAEPVCHVSYYEADAYARFAGARLPLESEWEQAAARAAVRGNLLESGALHPAPAPASGEIAQLFGDVWEWTASAYLPYPGYRPFAGALAEYNGKFMSNRMVLRGGSCATPARHVRATYRNFFAPDTRWQLAGLRLARER